MARHVLSNKDKKRLKTMLQSIGLWRDTMENWKIEVEEVKKTNYFSVSGVLIGMEKDGFIPSVSLVNAAKPENHMISVDDGAVPHIENGSNVFSKGVVWVSGDFKKGDMVFIKDQNNRFIGTGIAEMDPEEMMKRGGGTAVRTLTIKKED
ncbi:DUF1947 domain-containing protein [Caldiplasma sukawensis]